jgi:hypothetical protein
MDLNLKSASFFVEDQTWLRSPFDARTHGATMDVSTLTEADHYPNGYITSGLAVAQITSGGLYSNYDAAAMDGTETAKGLLFKSVVLDTTDLTVDIGITVMHAGDIVSTDLPTQGAVTDGDWDAAAAADLPAIVDLA